MASAPPGGVLSSGKNAQVATPNAANITPGPTRLTAPRPSRQPKNRLNTTPSAGNTRINASAGNATVIRWSPSHERQVVGVHGFTIAENRDDDAQADRCLGRRDRHHKEHDHLAVHRAEPAAYRDEGEINGVEHKLDRHEHHQNVAADDHAGPPRGE